MNQINNLKPQDLIPRLVSEFGYNDNSAALTAQDLCNLQPGLQEEFWNWWHDGKASSIVIHEFSVARLEKEFGFKPVNAFITLNWIANDPDVAISALKSEWTSPINKE